MNTTTEKIQNLLLTADLRRARDWNAAEALHISVPTMRRRLKREGTTFAALRDAEKRRRAVELLATNPHANGCQIADACGFAEKNAATRAFRAWFGSLREYKVAMRGMV